MLVQGEAYWEENHYQKIRVSSTQTRIISVSAQEWSLSSLQQNQQQERWELMIEFDIDLTLGSVSYLAAEAATVILCT